MPEPTEEEKMTKKTFHKCMGKVHIGCNHVDVEINTETTPNKTGGYDTVVKIPSAFPIGAVNETGGH